MLTHPKEEISNPLNEETHFLYAIKVLKKYPAGSRLMPMKVRATSKTKENLAVILPDGHVKRLRNDEIQLSKSYLKGSIEVSNNNSRIYAYDSSEDLEADSSHVRILKDIHGQLFSYSVSDSLPLQQKTVAMYNDLPNSASSEIIQTNDRTSATITPIPKGIPLLNLLGEEPEYIPFSTRLEIIRQCIALISSFHDGTLSLSGQSYETFGYLRPENFYVDQSANGKIEVTLTGYDADMELLCHKRGYNAPELNKALSENKALPFSFSTDIYALGVLLIGHQPPKVSKKMFRGYSEDEIRRQNINDVTYGVHEGLLLNIPEGTQVTPEEQEEFSQLVHLAVQMTHTSPKKRPTIEQLKTACIPKISTMTNAKTDSPVSSAAAIQDKVMTPEIAAKEQQLLEEISILKQKIDTALQTFAEHKKQGRGLFVKLKSAVSSRDSELRHLNQDYKRILQEKDPEQRLINLNVFITLPWHPAEFKAILTSKPIAKESDTDTTEEELLSSPSHSDRDNILDSPVSLKEKPTEQYNATAKLFGKRESIVIPLGMEENSAMRL